ncbi:DUF4386 domain-containing protein [Aquimarina gracilis]|uniref:DUF4386 domain-containing protein n=1 Tax=Aquimarina gracilis TaxID=874422 RepID=A0ABU5ZZ54_9FLAO|nr:DUF4386 domain-containing protein [Aquimarina gracilis]MEB3347090.1 DUF4386 domain-containing protein [Aquimarina gracilis]
MTQDIKLKHQNIARITGVIYLGIIACGIFSEAVVRSGLINHSNGAQTYNNILEHQSLFRLGIVSDILVLFGDIIVSILLYYLLKPISKILALIAASFRLIVVAISGANIFNMLSVLLLVSGTRYLNSFSKEQLESAMLFLFKNHSYGYDVALAFFGIHCLLLGMLIMKSKLIPKMFGIAFIITAICYFLFSFGRFIFPHFANSLYPSILLPPLVTELSLALWLLIKGINTPNIKSIT